MNSWVCASTPTVTRTRTAWRTPASPRDLSQPLDLVEGVDDDRPDPCGDGLAQLGDRLVVAVHADPLGREPGGKRDGELAAGAHVQAQALLGDPAGDRGAEERLAGVVDVFRMRPRSGRVGPGAPPQIRLVEQDHRRAVLARPDR